MPRPFNQKCAKCAFLDLTDSREQSCWVEGKCNNTRNYYRSRSGKLKNKQRAYAIATGKTPPVEFEIIPDTMRAELVIYGKRPNKQKLVKGRVKGIQVIVYKGSQEHYRSQVVATAGMTSYDLEALIDKAQEQTNEHFGTSRWGEIIWQDESV